MSNFPELPNVEIKLNGQKITVPLDKLAYINPDDLSGHLCDQPGLIAFFGEIKADRLRRKETAEMVFDEVSALARIKIRSEPRGTVKDAKGKEKPDKLTVQEIADFCSIDEDVKNAKVGLITAQANYERAKSWYDAARDKGISLNTLATIKKLEAGANDRITDEAVSTKRRAKYAPGNS